MKKLLGQKTTNLIALILLMLGVLAAFAYFSRQNAMRETDETRAIIRESAVLKEYRLEDAFADKLFAIGDMAYLYGETAKSEEVDRERLVELEINTHFNFVRFVDKEGINHSSDGQQTPVADRTYYLDGMNGNEGVCFIQNSRVNGEDLLGFYTPVYRQNEIIGVLLGICELDYVASLLAGVFQGHDAEAFLCSSNGTVIASVHNEFGPDFFNALSDRARFTAAEEENIREALRIGMATFFSYKTDLGSTTGYIQPIEINDWSLVQIYPDEALYENIYEANQVGFELLYVVFIFFVIYVVFLLVRFLMTRKALESESRKSRNISKAMQTILNRFVEIDLKNGTYEYISVKPFKNEIPDKGNYSVFADYIVNKLIEEDEKISMQRYLVLEELKKCFTDDVQYVSYLIHVLWEEERYENLTFVCIERDDQGEAQTIICMRMDVTKEQLMETQSKLALKEAYNSAEEANRAKSDFLSRMSHDIRTPLNAITGMTNIAKLHLEDKDKVNDCLSKIESSSGHLINLVNEVLDMSKIESGKMCLSEEPFDLYEIIDNITNITLQQALIKDICFTVKKDNIRHNLLIGDATRLEQLIINIISNAIKFTPSGGIVEVEVEEALSIVKGYAKFRIRCKDTGIGMDEETVKNVFDPFYRAKVSSNKIEGTGLGMSIAKNIANMMNGDISVESKPGEGTTFYVVIYQKKQSEQTKADRDIYAEESVCDYSDKRALIVEDNEINMEIAETLLGITGIRIEKATDGSHGYHKVLNSPENYFDIIFMDIQMPNLNGYECASAIRSIDRKDTKTLPIIAMSADAFVEDIKKSKKNGMNDHISKPVDMNKLLKVMQKYL